MGRKKIKIEPIADDKLRKVLKNGLLKKAAEISQLCNIPIFLSFEDCHGNLYYFKNGNNPNKLIFEKDNEKFSKNKNLFTIENYPNFIVEKTKLMEKKIKKTLLKAEEKSQQNLNSQIKNVNDAASNMDFFKNDRNSVNNFSFSNINQISTTITNSLQMANETNKFPYQNPMCPYVPYSMYPTQTFFRPNFSNFPTFNYFHSMNAAPFINPFENVLIFK